MVFPKRQYLPSRRHSAMIQRTIIHTIN